MEREGGEERRGEERRGEAQNKKRERKEEEKKSSKKKKKLSERKRPFSSFFFFIPLSRRWTADGVERFHAPTPRVRVPGETEPRQHASASDLRSLLFPLALAYLGRRV
ncbi:hypothetical protein IE53DRAFT_386498 [Violaceomyces palustris]|uniref:Uncharacterized protein n=1 Tax=Violaceomyces palustris TaxID=1673888 RepID=A0ACD0NZB2_9BASI|nr:hypothetical protein IE53DRAFT_386498 [Violaceomyces palustris]